MKSRNGFTKKNLMTGDSVTEAEVKAMIAAAITKHNRNASIISMWLGSFCLAAYTDGLLRMVGTIPPFMGIDISVL